MFISIYGLPGVVDAPVGWGWGVSIIATSLLCMVFLDFVKVQVIRYWSFELTAALAPTPARRRKLRERKETQERKARVEITKSKVRKVIHAISFVDLVGRGVPRSWEEGARRLSIAVSDAVDNISRRGSSVDGRSRRGSMMSRKASAAGSIFDGGDRRGSMFGRKATTESMGMRNMVAPDSVTDRKPSMIAFADQQPPRAVSRTRTTDNIAPGQPAPSPASLTPEMAQVPPSGAVPSTGFTNIPLLSSPTTRPATPGNHDREESEQTLRGERQ